MVVKYENGKLIVDLSLLPEGYDMQINVCGKMETPGIEIKYKSNVSYMRHGTWAELIDKKLRALPGARLDD